MEYDAAVTSRLLRTYLLYEATAAGVFFNAVFFVFYRDHVALSPPVIFALQSYNTGLRALLDLPFGAFADRRSRRACLVGSSTLVAAGAALLLTAPSAAAAWIAETLFAAGTALRSGADSALLYDALRAESRLGEYPRSESLGQAMASFGSGVAAVLGGLLAAVDVRLPYAATALVAVLTAAIATRLPEARSTERRRPRTFRALAEAGRRAAATSGVPWTIALAAFAVVASHVYYYLQQPYLLEIGVPVAAFGFVFAGTKAVTALVASAAHRLDGALGERRATALMALVPTVGLASMAAATGPLGAVLILSRGVLDGLWMPLLNIYMNRRVDSDVRATILSLMNVVSRLALAAALAAIGLALTETGLTATLVTAAITAAGAGAVLVAFARRSDPGSARPV
jgi:MFS family permease